MGGRRFAAGSLALPAMALLAAGCGEAPASGKVPVKVRLGTLHHAEVLGRGGMTVRLRSRNGGRYPVRALIRTRRGRQVRLGSLRRVGIPSRRWRRLDVPLGRAGRTALASCPEGRVVIRVGSGKRARSASAPLVLDPPDCARFFGPDAFWNRPLPRDAPLDPASGEISGDLEGR